MISSKVWRCKHGVWDNLPVICGLQMPPRRHEEDWNTWVTFKNPCSAPLVFRGEINLAPAVLAQAGKGDGLGVVKSLSCKDLGSAADPTPEEPAGSLLLLPPCPSGFVAVRPKKIKNQVENQVYLWLCMGAVAAKPHFRGKSFGIIPKL